MTLFRSKAEQKLVERGLDPARLPPGQYLTEKWPVLHAGSVPRTDLATWDFQVFGEVERPLRLTWEELRELPATEITVDIHCVTRWSRFDARFRGVHWRELATPVEAKPHARLVVAHAGPRLAAPPRRPEPLLLEEREVAPWPRAPHHRPAGLLGAVRLPQRRGLLEGRALRLLGSRRGRRTPSGDARR